MSELINTLDARSNSTNSRIDFQPHRGTQEIVWDRFITLDGKRAHAIGSICETCAFFFERLEGANDKVSPVELSSSLRLGLSKIDEKITSSAMEVLPAGNYKALLLKCVPQLISPSGKGDYFFEEQIELWGVDPFWGVPHYAKNEYYRTKSLSLPEGGALFEFVVPMFPARYLHQESIRSYKAILRGRALPTALAISILDVKGPAVLEGNPKVKTHWCLAHFLLDGHHKMYAASQVGGSLSLLSFLAVERGVSSPQQIAQLLSVLAGK